MLVILVAADQYRRRAVGLFFNWFNSPHNSFREHSASPIQDCPKILYVQYVDGPFSYGSCSAKRIGSSLKSSSDKSQCFVDDNRRSWADHRTLLLLRHALNSLFVATVRMATTTYNGIVEASTTFGKWCLRTFFTTMWQGFGRKNCRFTDL